MSSGHPGAASLELIGFLLLGGLAILLPLVPFDLSSGGRGEPDLVFCLAAAWILRRPRTAPLLAVLGLGLAGDVALDRPLGLGALALVLGTEAIRVRRKGIAGFFPAEWLSVMAVFAAMLAGSALVLRLAFADGPGLAAAAGHLAATAFAYPVVVGLLHWGLGLRGGAEARPGRAS